MQGSIVCGLLEIPGKQKEVAPSCSKSTDKLIIKVLIRVRYHFHDQIMNSARDLAPEFDIHSFVLFHA